VGGVGVVQRSEAKLGGARSDPLVGGTPPLGEGHGEYQSTVFCSTDGEFLYFTTSPHPLLISILAVEALTFCLAV